MLGFLFVVRCSLFVVYTNQHLLTLEALAKDNGEGDKLKTLNTKPLTHYPFSQQIHNMFCFDV